MKNKDDRLRETMDDRTVWFREIVAPLLDHLVSHGYVPSDLLDPESDALDETAVTVALEWWLRNQEPLKYGADGRIEDSVDRAEEKALSLLAIVRGAPRLD